MRTGYILMKHWILPHVFALRLQYAEPPSFSTAEMALLAVLMVLALVGFFWRFGRVLRNIFAARKDPDFHIAPIGKRIWEFFWEVICQAKVIKERPLPGLAHAFVFWGFLAFALVSLNHFASGFLVASSFFALKPGRVKSSSRQMYVSTVSVSSFAR